MNNLSANVVSNQKIEQSYISTIREKTVALNSKEEFKTFKNGVKLFNRITKAVMLSDDLLPEDIKNVAKIIEAFRFLTKGASDSVHMIRSLATLFSIRKKILFLNETDVNGLDFKEKALVYAKKAMERFALGSCEERRRLVKLCLSTVMTTALTTEVLYNTGVLQKTLQETFGEEQGLVYATALYAMGVTATQVWKTNRRFIFIETGLKQLKNEATTEKKQIKKFYSTVKMGLITGRLGFKGLGMPLMDKLSAIAAAALPFIQSKQPKKEKEEKVKKEGKVNKEKPEKTEKIKKIENKLSSASRIDQISRAVITLMICYQLYILMSTLMNPLGQDSLTKEL